MKLKILAVLDLRIFDTSSSEWIKEIEYDLSLPVVRIGRAKDCEIVIASQKYPNTCRSVSRYHASLYYYSGEGFDYWVQDGIPGTATLFSLNPPPLLSSAGVAINSLSRKLEKGEKFLLKDKDEIFLTPSVKLIYRRETKTVTEQLIEDTYIPPDLLL